MRLRCPILLALFSLAAAGAGWAVEIEAAPIRYSERQPRDRFAQLQARIEAGEASLQGATAREVLLKLLNYLEVPVESQVLVFSKTSAQNSHIDPAQPRAIYFSDDCYVGWVQGGNVEILTFDPEMGGIFYLLDVKGRSAGGEPRVERPASCLNCHQRATTGDVPGGLVRSVFAGADGMPFFHAGTYYVGPETPLKHRWGGWYVTGRTGNQTHMGNALAEESEGEVELQPIVRSGIQLDSIEGVIDTEPYLAGGSSDVVALMILEHQVAMHNTLAAANLSVRQLTHRTAEMHRSLGEPVPAQPEGTLKRVIESQAARIVQALLFADEHVMEGDGIDGGEAFQNAFARNARTSADGRSLKDLRLYERLFKHRCSYVIYSEVFDFLPVTLKDEVYRQLHAALTAPEGTDLSAHLSPNERSRIFEILIDTKEDLPSYWRDETEE